MTPNGQGTAFHLRVKGIDPSVVGHDYGAHLHSGPCVEGDGTAAGPHYNVSTATPPVVGDQTEVWLDFTVTEDGTGAGDATVPFVPAAGARAVVIHAEATAPNGTAGPRLVCLPVVW
jgi:Cu/Zn superoxide dismutase